MEEQRKPRNWGLWLAIGLVLLVAYLLSLGPYALLVFWGVIPPLHWLYTPLEQFPSFYSWLDGYGAWWIITFR